MSQSARLLFRVAKTLKVQGRGTLLQPSEWFGHVSVGEPIELRLPNGQVIISHIKELTTVRQSGGPSPVAVFVAGLKQTEGLCGAEVWLLPSESDASTVSPSSQSEPSAV